MKRILFISAILFAVLALLSACGGENGNKGTYYLYENGKTDTEQWFKLDGGNWTADGDLSGRYELNGNKITFYSTVFGEEEEVWSGALKDGKLTIDFMGAMMTYYLDGKAPTGGNAGTNADLGTTTGGVQTTEQPKNTYHITYDANGGAFANGEKTLVVNEQENAVLTAPDSPTRENYTFAGWAKQKNGSEMWNFANDKATQNATLYATWKEKSASILSVDGATINGNSIFMLVDRDTESVSLSGKVVCSSDSVWKLYYDKLGQTEIPTKIAAGLLGELQNGDNVFYAVVTSNDGTQVNVYDLTVHRSYAVSVNYYNGSELLKTDTAYTGSTYAVSYRPTIKGYTFNKWKTSTGAEVKSSLEIWEGQSFYADKTANTYTVTYDVNGGDPLSQTTKTVTYDSSYTLSVPKRTGYSFTGWTLSGTQLTNANGKSVSAWNYDGNRTLRAAWSANTYQTTLAKNISEAGTVTGEGEYTYGRSVTVSATTNNGYTWLGWYDKDDNQLTDNTSYTFTMGLDTTYTAKWINCPVTLVRDLSAGGSVSGVSNATYAGKETTITAKTNNGYTWCGWYNGETKLTDELSYTFMMPTENVTYTAKWTYYTLTTETNDSNGGLYTMKNDQKITAGQSVTLYASTNNGYTWLGWYNGDTKLTDELSYAFVMPTESLTYTAKWELITYAITYQLDEGINNQYNPSSYTVQDNSILLQHPTRANYDFVEWQIDSVKVSSIDTLLAKDLVIKAIWTPTVFSVTYDLNGGTNVAGNPTSFTILTAEGGIALTNPIRVTSVIDMNYEWIENGNCSVTRETTSYTFLGWYTENTFEHEITSVTCTGSDVFLYAKWSDTTTTAITTTIESVYERNGDYILFGEYPQTLKADDITVTGTPDARGYYLGSDGAYYAKVTATPFENSVSSASFNTGATVTSGAVYYFKVEPIKWRILSETDGTALVFCESIIAGHRYDDSSNNYANSEIRAWLNEQFYNTAFTELQQGIIKITTVDNSARSTNPNEDPNSINGGINTAVCDNTSDKIFLLSEQEVTDSSYGFYASYSRYVGDKMLDPARRKSVSDYSIATGVYSSDYIRNYHLIGRFGRWWLRSPDCFSETDVRYVTYDGNLLSMTNNYGPYRQNVNTIAGVVPALQVHFQ